MLYLDKVDEPMGRDTVEFDRFLQNLERKRCFHDHANYSHEGPLRSTRNLCGIYGEKVVLEDAVLRGVRYSLAGYHSINIPCSFI